MAREIRAPEKEHDETSPRTLEEIRGELGEIAVERRDLRIKVTEEERAREDEIRLQLGEMAEEIEAVLSGDSVDVVQGKAFATKLSDSAKLIHDARIAGLFELYELADFDDALLLQYDRFSELTGFDEVQAGDLQNFKETISFELMLRELEDLFNKTTHQVQDFFDNIAAVKPVAVQGCAEGLGKCTDSLFDFEVGGVLRVDEFVSYVEVLRENHAALLKLSLSRGIEMPDSFTELMGKTEQLLVKHEANLQDVRKLLDGQENVMSFERYNELAIELATNYKMYVEWQKKMIRESHGEAVAAQKAAEDATFVESVAAKDEGKVNLDEPIWEGIGSTSGGRRFQLGFRQKKGCEYGRCANCCLFHGSGDKNITADNIKNQFQFAVDKYGLETVERDGEIEWANPDLADLKRMDFEMTGSYLNDAEVPEAAQLEIFERIGQMPFERVMIDTRIEYVTLEKIRALKAKLRPDQKLEIAIGLESANNLIRELAILKGYSLDQFENAAQVLASEGVDILIHSLVKPALITEGEALEDSKNTGRYLSGLVDRLRDETGNPDFGITMKLEQAFIQPGGYLDYLHHQSKEENGEEKRYETPWSFTVAKVVQDLHDEGVAEELNLQIGKSDDYPPPTDVTRNRDAQADLDANGGVESTKVIYEALQKYNVDHDIEAFSTVVEEVVKNYPETFALWQKKFS